MKGRHSKPEQIIPKLREAEVELAKGHSVAEQASEIDFGLELPKVSNDAPSWVNCRGWLSETPRNRQP
jgi:hypothetical protein